MSKSDKVKGVKLNRSIIFAASFLVPVLIYFTTLWLSGFFPNGDKTLLFMDLKGQYTEFLASLRYIFDDNSLFFNWSRSMGGNVLGLYAFYSGGIFAFISCLFSLVNLHAAVMVITLVMIGASGLSMSIFLELGVSLKPGRYGIIIFSACYALMSYNMVYANCFMWLSGSIFLPLVMLGIEQILRGKKGLLLYITLSISMINNYYTAYMICIFSVLYILFRLVTIYFANRNYKEPESDTESSQVYGRKYLFRSFGTYAVSSLLAAMTAAPVLVPVFKDLISGKLTSTVDYEVGSFYYPFGEVFKKLLPGQYDSITYDNIHPQLYAGLVVLVFAVIFFFIKTHRMAEKIAGSVIIGILLVSFWCVGIDKVWHGFQMPHWFPFRYAFIFGFFMVYLGYRAYDALINERLCSRLAGKFRLRPQTIGLIICGILLIECSVELSKNASNYINGLGKDFGYMKTSEYSDFYDRTEPLVKQVKSSDDTWFRMDKDYEFSKNDAMLFGYNGMTHYSSTYNAGVNLLTPKLGLAQSWYWNSGYGATPLVDAIFGVKYRIAEKAMPKYYKKIGENGDVSLYMNPTALSIGYAASDTLIGAPMPEGDVFTNQDTVINGITGDDTSCFVPQEYVREDAEGSTTLKFYADADGPAYIYMTPYGGTWGEIYVNDVFVNNYFSTETTCAVFLGEFTAGQEVNVRVDCADGGFTDAWIVRLDEKSLSEKLTRIGERQLKISDYGAGTVKGSITVGEGQVLATTLPYDEGFTVMCDGEKVTCERWFDTFIAVRIPEGTHEISVSFTPSGFVIGVMMCGVAVLIVIGIAVFDKIYRKRFTK